jgi:hypothetical protein
MLVAACVSTNVRALTGPTVIAQGNTSLSDLDPLNSFYGDHPAGSLVLDCCVLAQSVIPFRDNVQVIFHRIYNDMSLEADIKHQTKALLFLTPTDPFSSLILSENHTLSRRAHKPQVQLYRLATKSES